MKKTCASVSELLPKNKKRGRTEARPLALIQPFTHQPANPGPGKNKNSMISFAIGFGAAAGVAAFDVAAG